MLFLFFSHIKNANNTYNDTNSNDGTIYFKIYVNIL